MSFRWNTIYGPHDFAEYLVTDHWNDVGGVYVFSGRNIRGELIPIYIGQTESFRDRIPCHERWAEAVALGAYVVDASVETRPHARDLLEQDLIRAFSPPLNSHFTISRPVLGTLPQLQPDRPVPQPPNIATLRALIGRQPFFRR